MGLGRIRDAEILRRVIIADIAWGGESLSRSSCYWAVISGAVAAGEHLVVDPLTQPHP